MLFHTALQPVPLNAPHIKRGGRRSKMSKNAVTFLAKSFTHVVLGALTYVSSRIAWDKYVERKKERAKQKQAATA